MKNPFKRKTDRDRKKQFSHDTDYMHYIQAELTEECLKRAGCVHSKRANEYVD